MEIGRCSKLFALRCPRSRHGKKKEKGKRYKAKGVDEASEGRRGETGRKNRERVDTDRVGSVSGRRPVGRTLSAIPRGLTALIRSDPVRLLPKLVRPVPVT